MTARQRHSLKRTGLPLGLAATCAVGLLLCFVYLARPLLSHGEGHVYPYPRPALTVDSVIVQLPTGDETPKVLLARRRNPPFQGYFALPGGFVEEGEGLDAAAARELLEETSLVAKDFLVYTQVGTFGDPGRDPRGWLVNVVYAGLVPPTAVQAADDVTDASWHDLLAVPTPLAVDHQPILSHAFRQLAREPAAQQVAGLVDQLTKAADMLSGPWQHVEGEKPPQAGTQ